MAVGGSPGLNIENSGLLFTHFENEIVGTLNDTVKAFNMVKQDKVWRGDYIEFPLHLKRNPAMQFSEDGGAFPTPKQQTYTRARVSRRFFHAKLRLTDGIMAAAKTDPNVVKDAVRSEVDRLLVDVAKFYNGMFFRDGTGAVARLMTGSPTTGTSNILVDDSRMLWPGGTYQLYDTTLATNRGNVIISNQDQALDSTYGQSSVDLDSTTSLSSLSGVTASDTTGDLLVWNGSLNRAIAGLDLLIDDSSTTFQNVSTSSNPKYTSVVLSNSGTLRDLTPTLFRQLLAAIKQKAGGENPSEGLKVFSDNWMSIEMEELYEGELRLTPETTTGGVAINAFQSTLGRIELVNDPDCPRHKIFACDTSKLVHAVQMPLGFRKTGGEIFLRSDDAASHSATMIQISQMYIKERHTSGKMKDIRDQATHAY